MRLSTLLPLLGLFAFGYAEKCPRRKTSLGKEILCYTASNNADILLDSICECTTLVHQGHELHNLSIAGVEKLQKTLKEANPILQVVVSVTDNQGALKVSGTSRQEASGRLANLLTQVDGIELSMNAGSKERLTHFVKGLKDEMIRKSNEKRIILALPTKPEDLAKQYDLKTLAKYVDLFTISTDYLYDNTESFKTFHPSRLMGIFDMLNTDSLVDLISGMGVPKKKLLVSVPASAYKFTLTDEEKNTPGSPAEKGDPKSISQKELCDLMSAGEWTVERDEDLTAPYAFKDSTWIAYEDKTSIGIKGKYVLLRELAGMGVHNIENDVNNNCGKTVTYEVYRSFTDMKRKTRGAVLASLENDLQHAQIPQSKNVRSSEFRIVRVVDTAGAIHAIRENTQTEFICTRQGYFVHPKSCNRFYRCVKFNQGVDDYSVFEFDCPAGLAFDERTEVCVWPGSLTEGSPCPGSSEIAPVPRARFQCPQRNGYYADPQNCRWFFACFDLGEPELMAYEFRCPFGLVFDEEKLICEWPWLVPGCGVSGYSRTEYGGSGSGYVTKLNGYGSGSGQYSLPGGIGVGGYAGNGIGVGVGGGASGQYGGADASSYSGSKASESRRTENEAGFGGFKYSGQGAGGSQYGNSGQGAGGIGNFGSAIGDLAAGLYGKGTGNTGSSGYSGSGNGGSNYNSNLYQGAGFEGLKYQNHEAGLGAAGDFGGFQFGAKFPTTISTGSGHSGYSGQTGSTGGLQYNGVGEAGVVVETEGHSGAGGYTGSSGSAVNTAGNSGFSGFGNTATNYQGFRGTNQGIGKDGLTVSVQTGGSDAGSYAGATGSDNSGYYNGNQASGNTYSSGAAQSGYSNEGKGGYVSSGGSESDAQDVINGGLASGSGILTGTTGNVYVGGSGTGGGYTSVTKNTLNGLDHALNVFGVKKPGTAGPGILVQAVTPGYAVTGSGISHGTIYGGSVTGAGHSEDGAYVTGSGYQAGNTGSGGVVINHGSNYNGGYVSSTPSSGSGVTFVNSGAGYEGGSAHREIGSSNTVSNIGKGEVSTGTSTYHGNGGSSSTYLNSKTNSNTNANSQGASVTVASHDKETGVFVNGDAGVGSVYGGSRQPGYVNTASSTFQTGTPVPSVLVTGTAAPGIILHSTSDSGAYEGGQVHEGGVAGTVTYHGNTGSSGSYQGGQGHEGVVAGTVTYHGNTGSAGSYEGGQSNQGGVAGTTTYHGSAGSSGSYQGGQGHEGVVAGTVTYHGNTGSAGSYEGEQSNQGGVAGTTTYHGNAGSSGSYQGGQSHEGGVAGTVTYHGNTGSSGAYQGGQSHDGGLAGTTTYHGNTGSSGYVTSTGYEAGLSQKEVEAEIAGSIGGEFGSKVTSSYVGTAASNSDRDMGYKTNEYESNGGRGTVTFNNGNSASKFTESDLRGQPAYASLPDTIVSGGRIENSGGVVLGNTLAGIDAYTTSHGFSKTGGSNTGYQITQTGGSSAGYSHPTPTPGSNVFGGQTSIGQDVNNLAYVTSTASSDVSHIDTSKINLGTGSSDEGSSGYIYGKPTVQFISTASTPSPLPTTYHGPIVPLTVTTPSPYLNVETVYNNPTVVTSAPITAAPAVVNTYSYRRPTSTSSGSTVSGGYKYRRPTQTIVYQNSGNGGQRTTVYRRPINVQNQYSATPTSTPIAYATGPAEIYKSTLFEAAKQPITVSTVAPVFDTGYKTVVSSTAAPIAVSTGQYFYSDSRFQTGSVSSTEQAPGHLDITYQVPEVTFQKEYVSSTLAPKTETGYTYEKPTKQFTYNSPSTAAPSVTVYQQPEVTYRKPYVSPTPAPNTGSGYTYEKPRKQLSYNSPSTVSPSVTVYDQPEVTINQQVKYVSQSGITPGFDGTYKKPSVSIRPAFNRQSTYQKGYGVSSTVAPAVHTQGYDYSKPAVKFVTSTVAPCSDNDGGSPTKLDISQKEITKLVNNYNRGGMRYTPPNIYVDNNGESVDSENTGFGNKNYGNTIVTKTYQPTTPDSVVRTNSYNSYSSSTKGYASSPSVYNTGGYASTPLYEVSTVKSVSGKGKGKVIVKLSDLHPLLLGKLGAQCTCRSDPFETLRGPGTKIIKSSRGDIDLAQYDESQIYVDLESDGEPNRSADIHKSRKSYPTSSSVAYPSPTSSSISYSSSTPSSISYLSSSSSPISYSSKTSSPISYPSPTSSSIAYPSSTSSFITYTSPSRTPVTAVFGLSTPAPKVFRSRGKPSTAYLPVSSTASPIDDGSYRGGSSSSKIVPLDNGGYEASSGNLDPQYIDRPAGFVFEDVPAGHSAGGTIKSGKYQGSSSANGNAIGGAGAAFDRYGPGGLRGVDETLQGSTDCARPGLFRHPKLCNKFYACHWDEWKQKYTLHVFNCPVHLSFDSNAGACNWPSKGPACQDDNLLV